MTSQEVNSAVGEAPARKKSPVKLESVYEVLTNKRTELMQAYDALDEAEKRYDTEGAVAAQGKIDVLNRFIDRLVVEHQVQLDAAGKAKAKLWLDARQRSFSDLVQRIESAQQQVRDALSAAVEAINAEVAIRAEANDYDNVRRIFEARFGLERDKTRPVLPAVEDYATSILEAVDQMRPSRQPVVQIIPAHQASDTPERRREKERRAVVKAIKQFKKHIPEDARKILKDAPLPEYERPEPMQVSRIDPDDAIIGTGGLGAALANAPTSVPIGSGV